MPSPGPVLNCSRRKIKERPVPCHSEPRNQRSVLAMLISSRKFYVPTHCHSTGVTNYLHTADPIKLKRTYGRSKKICLRLCSNPVSNHNVCTLHCENLHRNVLQKISCKTKYRNILLQYELYQIISRKLCCNKTY